MFILEQNGENLMISLEIDLERFGTHLEIMRKSNTVIPRLARFLIARICTARICDPA